MIIYLSKRKGSALTNFIIIFTIISLFTIAIIAYFPRSTTRQTYTSALSYIPAPTEFTGTTAHIDLPVLKGLKIYQGDPFKFDFFIDEGGKNVSGQKFEEESSRLIKYFLSALTIPEKDLWVNLSPYEGDKIVPQALGLTEMGKDLLGEDYILKQLMASLTYPETPLGRDFWFRVYSRAQTLFGTTKIPINTFNKIWIVPEQAVVYEDRDRAFVGEAKLKVMMEGDYLLLKNNLNNPDIEKNRLSEEEVVDINDFSSEIMKEVILPVIEEEVNKGENFARLRQIYYSLILATWFKKKLKDSIINQVYADKKKVKGIEADNPGIKDRIYNQYVEAYKKGVYDYIKKDYDGAIKKTVQRRYFSGGFDGTGFSERVFDTEPLDFDVQNPLEFSAGVRQMRIEISPYGEQQEKVERLKERMQETSDLFIDEADLAQLGDKIVSSSIKRDKSGFKSVIIGALLGFTVFSSGCGLSRLRMLGGESPVSYSLEEKVNNGYLAATLRANIKLQKEELIFNPNADNKKIEQIQQTIQMYEKYLKELLALGNEYDFVKQFAVEPNSEQSLIVQGLGLSKDTVLFSPKDSPLWKITGGAIFGGQGFTFAYVDNTGKYIPIIFLISEIEPFELIPYLVHEGNHLKGRIPSLPEMGNSLRLWLNEGFTQFKTIQDILDIVSRNEQDLDSPRQYFREFVRRVLREKLAGLTQDKDLHIPFDGKECETIKYWLKNKVSGYGDYVQLVENLIFSSNQPLNIWYDMYENHQDSKKFVSLVGEQRIFVMNSYVDLINGDVVKQFQLDNYLLKEVFNVAQYQNYFQQRFRAVSKVYNLLQEYLEPVYLDLLKEPDFSVRWEKTKEISKIINENLSRWINEYADIGIDGMKKDIENVLKNVPGKKASSSLNKSETNTIADENVMEQAIIENAPDANSSIRLSNPGGIDLNVNGLLDVKTYGNSESLNSILVNTFFDFSDFQGFTFKIIHIKKVDDINMFVS